MKTLNPLFVFIAGFCAITLVYLPILNAQEASPAASPAGSSASTSPSQKADTEWDGVSVELSSVTRGDGDTITIKFKYTNSGSKTAVLNTRSDTIAAQVYYVDGKNKKKYLVVQDSQGNAVASNLHTADSIEAGGSRGSWAKFPAPPAGVDKITVYLPGAPPFEGVTITSP